MSTLYRDLLTGFKEIAELTGNQELKKAAEAYLAEDSAANKKAITESSDIDDANS